MSRSPRRLLRTASEALDVVHDLCERYPDARQEIERALGGPEHLATVEAARAALRRATDIAPATPDA